MKRFVGYVIDKAVKALPRKKKVSPTIKSVKPTKDVKGSIKRTKRDAFSKNIDDLDKAQKKIREGKKMMKEGQKSRKQMTGTGRAFQFKNLKSYHAVEPGDMDKFKGSMKKEKTKKFKTAKQMEKDERRKREKEPFMGGGMAGRRMGYKGGSNGSKKGKVPTTPKEKAFGMLSVNKGLDKNKNITFTDKIAGATGGKKKKRVI